MQRLLIVLGAALLALGLAWPWVRRLNLGRLPGDIVVQRENFSFYFPVTTIIVVSLVLSAIAWFFRK